MGIASVQLLDPAGDPGLAHAALDEMLAATQGPASAVVIVYTPGSKPVMTYYGRTMTAVEMRGVLLTLAVEV